MNTKLLDEAPLIVLPSLAAAVGLNQAIVLQQLHWMLRRDSVLTDEGGVRWISVSLDKWSEIFPFWSESTVRRVLQELRDAGLVATTRGRESNVYALDYDALVVKLNSPECSDCTLDGVQNEQSPCKREEARESSGETSAATAVAASGEDAHLPGMEPDAPPPPAKDVARPAEDDAAVNEVWAHYLLVFADRLRVKELTPPRAKAIKKALNAVNRDVDLCKRAIDGLKSYRTTHASGSQDIGLAVIFATGPQSRSNLTDQIEWWAGQAGDQTAIPASVPSAHRGRVMELVVATLKMEQQPDNEGVRERGEQAQAQLSERFGLKVISDGAGKLVRFEAIPR